MFLKHAVEAARAGEHGEGFRVLAEEIRDLAMEERENTRQITQIIQDIQKSMKLAVKSVESGKASATEASKAADSLKASAENLLSSISQFKISPDSITQVPALVQRN